MLHSFNPATGKADRVGFKTLEDGKKVRYFKSNGEVLILKSKVIIIKWQDYKNIIKRLLKHLIEDEFAYNHVMEVPKITKITLNMGLGEAVADKKIIRTCCLIWQKLQVKNRLLLMLVNLLLVLKFVMIGLLVVKLLYVVKECMSFLIVLINIAIPRIRDFRGLNPKSFDGRGNYSMGINEQIIFPEIDYDKIDALRGMDITITTTAKTDEEGKALLEAFNFPFKKVANSNNMAKKSMIAREAKRTKTS